MHPSANSTDVAFRFDHFATVLNSDLDANGHANNVVYLRWIQEASVAHWLAAVDPTLASQWKWVVVRHEIDYKKPAQLHDALVVRTWLGEITVVTTERFCEIRRQVDEVLLAQARTIWCALDHVTGRPKRLDPRIRSYFYDRGPSEIPQSTCQSSPAGDEGSSTESQTVAG